MDKSEILRLFDQDQRREIEYPGTRREVTREVVRHVDTTPTQEGAVLFHQLDELNADAVIREQIGYFQSLGQSFEWKHYDHDRPHDLKDRLQAAGFVCEEAEAVMVLDLESAPQVLAQPVPPQVRRLVDPAQLADVRRVHEQVWGEDSSWVLAYLGGALRDYPDRMSVYVAYAGEQPVSVGWVYFPPHSQFASLWGGSTISDFRKQGLYTALLAVRAQEAAGRRVRFLTVDASPMSRPVLEKYGFELITYTYPCRWELDHAARAASHLPPLDDAG
jgi:hypothetical protein